jgi:hypothetical protein
MQNTVDRVKQLARDRSVRIEADEFIFGHNLTVVIAFSRCLQVSNSC